MKKAAVALCICFALSGAVSACTGVALVGEGAVVVGGNEDNDLRNPAMWATAAAPGRYGAVYFGFMFPGGLANRIVDVYTGWDFTSRARLDVASLCASGNKRTFLSNLVYTPSGLP